MNRGMVAERIEVDGIVQGVGFRPFVRGLATELGLVGHVGNDSAKVFVELVGSAEAIDRFVDRLRSDAPPLARVDGVTRRPGDRRLDPPTGFTIVDSVDADGPRTLIAPDTAVCADCLGELADPDDRRHRHPFITCTNCGPRFSIVTAVPYDRPNTTMGGFPMCPRCRAEYDDPTDRRFHAQPLCCHDCGPRLTLRRPGVTGSPEPEPEAEAGGSTGAAAAAADRVIESAAAAIAEGGIVAVKGLGGYHLAVDATDHNAVAELRRRKHRPDKPFAVAVADLDMARAVGHVSEAEAELLTSPAAPIVLVRARVDTPLSPAVAPGNPLIGIQLASTPVHHLLLAELDRPIVLTSANRGGEPIAWTSAAIDDLADVVDLVLDHDRPIHQPCDDSVVRVVGNRLLPIRRARGYAPIPVALPGTARPVLAVGAELKNTFCLAADGRAWVSQHIGDMENLATLEAFESSVAAFRTMYEVEPELVVADAHPGYLSSGWARRHHRSQLVEVQHHHAHVAAVMAEHGLDPTEPVIGIAFDGTGWGPDGTIWGGEILVVDATGFERVAHLAPVPLPGGDAAIEQPARVALAHLHAAGLPWSPGLAPVDHLSEAERELLRRQLDGDLHCIPTTSMGRLFDAVAALVGLRQAITYEAQAAIELEIAAATATATGDPIDPAGPSDAGYRFARRGPELDPAPVLAALVDDLAAGVDVGTISWRFHRAVTAAVVEVAVEVAAALHDRHGPRPVALTGGVFQNALLTTWCVEALAASGLDALTHSLVPPNDGGLALGQAYLAATAAANRPIEET